MKTEKKQTKQLAFFSFLFFFSKKTKNKIYIEFWGGDYELLKKKKKRNRTMNRNNVLILILFL